MRTVWFKAGSYNLSDCGTVTAPVIGSRGQSRALGGNELHVIVTVSVTCALKGSHVVRARDAFVRSAKSSKVPLPNMSARIGTASPSVGVAPLPRACLPDSAQRGRHGSICVSKSSWSGSDGLELEGRLHSLRSRSPTPPPYHPSAITVPCDVSTQLLYERRASPSVASVPHPRLEFLEEIQDDVKLSNPELLERAAVIVHHSDDE